MHWRKQRDIIMHKLYGNNIRLTRGDTLAVAVGLWNADGTEYEPSAGDVIRFALKQDYAQDTPILNIIIPNDTQILTINPNDTKDLAFGNYVYDIELTKEDGTVDTFIAEATFTVAPEVH